MKKFLALIGSIAMLSACTLTVSTDINKDDGYDDTVPPEEVMEEEAPAEPTPEEEAPAEEVPVAEEVPAQVPVDDGTVDDGTVEDAGGDGSDTAAGADTSEPTVE